ncbi:MAG: SPFH domain-containing protein [Desulfobulbaceae bacterium]|nr:SPFH domain-containing protein [Desulfobulbaceae bacterium]
MANKTKTITGILLTLCIFGAGFILTRQREIVGTDQIGVVISPGSKITVYQAGESPFVIPGIQHYVKLTAKPIRYELTDSKSLIIAGPNQQPIKIGCQVRYRIEDAAKLVKSLGALAPQAAVEALILQQLKDAFQATLQKTGASLDDVQTRVVLVGDIHQSMKQTLSPLGIDFLSFDLFSW